MASENQQSFSLDEFYNCVKSDITNANNSLNLRFITSRSTLESTSHIQLVCSVFESNCRKCEIPIKGVSLEKTELSVKVFKYLICNTNFDCQKLLLNDKVSGHLVNSHPPLSLYLLIEIIWHLHFDDILAESMLYFPLDLCTEITEVLPRCIDLLDFQRAVKFLTTFVQNIYKKLISLKDVGIQTQDLNKNVKKLIGNFQELLLLFINKKVFKSTDGSIQEKRSGILLKKILQMINICSSYKSKKFEVSTEMQKLYELTFGDDPLEKVDTTLLDQFLTETNQGLIRLLLQKMKELKCETYVSWTEWDDDENTSLSLQRAVRLESQIFIESTKEFIDCDTKDLLDLTKLLEQIAAKPDPNNSVESLNLTDLCQGVSEGKKECLIGLFKRYKEWDNSIINTIDSNIFLVDKEICEQLFAHLAIELCNSHNLEKLQLYTASLVRAFVSLKIVDLYEVAVKFILHFGENMKFENDINISKIENYVMHNPNLSNATNLRVVIFFLCLKTMPTLKILLKMAIGHSDYPDVAISIDDLMILFPILKIKTESMLETLRAKWEEKRKGFKSKEEPPKSVTLIIRVLQEICLEGPKWKPNKFAELLQATYSLCKVTEVINEIFTPFLMMGLCPVPHLRVILVEMQKVIDICDEDLNPDIISSMHKQGLELLNSKRTSRYIVDDLMTLIIELSKKFMVKWNAKRSDDQIISYRNFFLIAIPAQISDYVYLHQSKSGFKIVNYQYHLNYDDVLRHIFLKCTKKQLLEYVEQIVSGKGVVFKWSKRTDVYDTLIRFTLENCLLCLEYPNVAPPDSISFMIRRLTFVLPLITDPKKKNNSSSDVCRNLDSHLAILKSSVERTAISQAYSELVTKCEKAKQNLQQKLVAFEKFACSCSQQNENIKVFKGPHSPMGIRLWIIYDTITALLDESITNEKYIMKLDQYFQ